MTTSVDIANRALIDAGVHKKINSLTQDSEEAATINMLIFLLRDELNRMAPWNCARKYTNLVYVSSQPGTPENSAAGPPLWVPGMPPPQWSYEYQYPVDCARARYIIPQYTTGFSGGIPITTAVTGVATGLWTGPPIKFKVGIDQFYSVTFAAVAAGGVGYAIGDYITLAQPSFTFNNQGSPIVMPVGAPVVLQVLTLAGSAVATVAVINQIFGESSPQGGSYFAPMPNPQAQGSTTGAGTGATFNLTYAATPNDQRVILTNQEFAILCYNRIVTDPNSMDEHFVDAWVNILGARLCSALNGDKERGAIAFKQANEIVAQARITDGDEGMTVNDVTPDFIRFRGIDAGPNWEYSPNLGFDWGPMFVSQ